MHTGNVTTPFGRRPMTYGMVADQLASLDLDENASVDKWKLYRWICAARPKLGISDRSLSLLNALLTFYPKSELAACDNLMVFPSNAQLSLRAHGMAEATIRRHLGALVQAGLLIRRDSANGKRFARRHGDGAIGEAFGFSLALLLAKAEEFEATAAAVEAERVYFQSLRERFTICRRDVAKLLEAAGEEGETPLDDLRERYRNVMERLPRQADTQTVEMLLIELEDIGSAIVKAMTEMQKAQNMSGNPDHFERHKQNSNTKNSSDSELASDTKPGERQQYTSDGETKREGEKEKDDRRSGSGVGEASKSRTKLAYSEASGLKPFPLGMVLSACPEIQNYGPNSTIKTWRDLMSAAVIVRSMLGVSPSAYEDACVIMGPENAATVIACILERAGHINSAGGYLRDLTRRAEKGEFSLGPVLMAQMRANGNTVNRRA